MEKKRRKGLLVVLVFLVIAGVCAGGIYLAKNQSGQKNEQFPRSSQITDRMPNEKTDGMFIEQKAGGSVVATGTTVIGMDMEKFEPDYIETDLEIAEVYLESGIKVQAGTAILKITNSSLEAAREELKETLTKASLAYRAGIISYKQSEIKAGYDRDSAVLEGEQAQEVYEDSIAQLEEELKQAQEAVVDMEKDIAEYEDILSTNRYYTDYRIAELQETYQEDYDLFCEFLNTYNITPVNVETGKFDVDQTQPPRDQLMVYQSFWKTIQQEAQDLTKARENYQKAQDSANETLQELYISEMRKSILTEMSPIR